MNKVDLEKRREEISRVLRSLLDAKLQLRRSLEAPKRLIYSYDLMINEVDILLKQIDDKIAQ